MSICINLCKFSNHQPITEQWAFCSVRFQKKKQSKKQTHTHTHTQSHTTHTHTHTHHTHTYTPTPIHTHTHTHTHTHKHTHIQRNIYDERVGRTNRFETWHHYDTIPQSRDETECAQRTGVYVCMYMCVCVFVCLSMYVWHSVCVYIYIYNSQRWWCCQKMRTWNH